ncbi:MAG: hypothetical protein UFG06_07155 [Lachnospiraceae bacterium]|nr:hypothetical protein [Lachnospiraceae bacterium]
MACRCGEIWKCSLDSGKISLAIAKALAMRIPAELAIYNTARVKNDAEEAFDADNREEIVNMIGGLSATLSDEAESLLRDLQRANEALSCRINDLSREDEAYHLEEQRQRMLEEERRQRRELGEECIG